MGKKIDKFAFVSMLAIFLFFYFYTAFKHRGLAVILALLSCIVFIKLYQRIKKLLSNTRLQQRRTLRRDSKGALMYLACMEQNEAYERIAALLKTCYQTEAYIELEQLHPSLKLSSNRVFDLWRNHRQLSELIICTTGSCTSETRLLAESLKQPRVAVLDAAALAQLIAEHPQGFYPAKDEKTPRQLRLKQLAALVFNRRNAPRCILFSFSMLVMYIFSGSIYYLAFSLGLLFTALSSFHHPVRPAKLF